MADTMIHFSDNSLSTCFLNEEEIHQRCPYAFLTNPSNPDVSNKYVQATTFDVINDLHKLGWYPVVAKQCRNKKNSRGIRSFHMIALQNPDIKVIDKNGNIEAYPRIILTNSHDGFNSFKFMCGLFRTVCSNGLVIADEEFSNMNIRHINYNFEELRKMVVSFLENLPNKIEVINTMRETILTDEQKINFAIAAVKLRKGYTDEDKVDISNDTIEEVLTPVRKEDEGNNLWKVFNVIQEKIVKGRYSYGENGKKSRKVRPLTSIVKDLQINKTLFNIANTYVNVAA